LVIFILYNYYVVINIFFNTKRAVNKQGIIYCDTHRHILCSFDSFLYYNNYVNTYNQNEQCHKISHKYNRSYNCFVDCIKLYMIVYGRTDVRQSPHKKKKKCRHGNQYSLLYAFKMLREPVGWAMTIKMFIIFTCAMFTVDYKIDFDL